MFFKHKYLSQSSITSIDTVLCASDDLCQILKGLSPVKDNTRISVNILMDIFKNIGAKDETKVDKQRARMGAAATEHTQSDEAEETGVWVKPDEAELADNNLRATEQVEIRRSGNHLSPRGNGNVTGQEKVNPDATLRPKPRGPNFIKDANPKPRRSSRRSKVDLGHYRSDQS